MSQPDLTVVSADESIAGTEPDGLLCERDRFLYRSGEELAVGKRVKLVNWIEIGRDRRLVFGYGLRISTLRPQHFALGRMRKTIAGRCGQGLPGQVFRAHQIIRRRV